MGMSKLTDLLLADAYVGGGSGGGGGDTWKETLLWENPNPDTEFSSSASVPKETWEQYDWIRFFYKEYASATASSWSIILPVSDIKLRYGNVNMAFATGNGAKRGLYYWNNTKAIGWYGSAYAISSTAVKNNSVIPLAIYGIKKG